MKWLTRRHGKATRSRLELFCKKSSSTGHHTACSTTAYSDQRERTFEQPEKDEKKAKRCLFSGRHLWNGSETSHTGSESLSTNHWRKLGSYRHHSAMRKVLGRKRCGEAHVHSNSCHHEGHYEKSVRMYRIHMLLCNNLQAHVRLQGHE